ncbi:glutamate--cysteine ligase [Permianibacter sp. IMCC34836]|uniref:YbdK family carboxylate-amine ligase n=1 Tax=Permianibacter fluminis TaxID=2738515 RepID=UPI001558246D|nr:YbdK family carboxylate-amine ligase [Permianibacter fluminis]NQD38751.1 glutamate--cysteine ligase [Permianibacter fluminis]
MLTFTASAPLTLGVELELQLIDKQSRDLTPAAPELLTQLQHHPQHALFKPEITRSMIELNSSKQSHIDGLQTELFALRDVLVEHCTALDIGIAGGGTHPFQHWADREIYPGERFAQLADDYGYLARRFTVFGQHIHIGVPNGDAAVYLSQQLLRYIPHFVALAASSPYHLGIDTGLDCARLAAVWTFPLAGHMPSLRNWQAFNQYFADLQRLGVASSIKDLYWDVRPKPEFGTVEIRIADTPLSIQRAIDLAAYAQTLAKQLLEQAWQPMPDALQLVHRHNLFQACRHGYRATLVNPFSQEKLDLKTDLLRTLDNLQASSKSLDTQANLDRLATLAGQTDNDSRRIRALVANGKTLADVVDVSCARWRDNH